MDLYFDTLDNTDLEEIRRDCTSIRKELEEQKSVLTAAYKMRTAIGVQCLYGHVMVTKKVSEIRQMTRSRIKELSFVLKEKTKLVKALTAANVKK